MNFILFNLNFSLSTTALRPSQPQAATCSAESAFASSSEVKATDSPLENQTLEKDLPSTSSAYNSPESTEADQVRKRRLEKFGSNGTEDLGFENAAHNN